MLKLKKKRLLLIILGGRHFGGYITKNRLKRKNKSLKWQKLTNSLQTPNKSAMEKIKANALSYDS